MRRATRNSAAKVTDDFKATPCPHSAKLASQVAADIGAVIAGMSELIGDGNEDADRLVLMRNTLSRAGWLVDLIGQRHGATPFATNDISGEGWLLRGDQAEAFAGLADVLRTQRSERRAA